MLSRQSRVNGEPPGRTAVRVVLKPAAGPDPEDETVLVGVAQQSFDKQVADSSRIRWVSDEPFAKHEVDIPGRPGQSGTAQLDCHASLEDPSRRRFRHQPDK